MKSTFIASLLGATIGSACAQIEAGWIGGALAEGYTSESPGAPIDSAYRMFTTTSGVCETSARPARLDVPPDAVTVAVGEWFSLSSVPVHAYDDSGAFVPKVPLLISLYYSPGAFDSSAEDRDSGRFLGAMPGQAIAIYEDFCARGAGQVRTEVPIRVVM